MQWVRARCPAGAGDADSQHGRFYGLPAWLPAPGLHGGSTAGRVCVSLPRFAFWAAGQMERGPAGKTVEGSAGEKRGRWKAAFVYELTLAKLTGVCGLLAEKAFFCG